MRSHRHPIAVGLLIAGVLLPIGPAGAQSQGVWHVEHRLVGKGDKKSEDVSGIACISDTGFPRQCLVIDDNLQSAQLVTVKDGEIVAGQSVQLIDDQHEGTALELDGEGVAYANGFFYVIGSHGHPRDKGKKLDAVTDAAKIRARIAASSQLVRLRVHPVTGRPVTATGVEAEVPEITRTARLKAILVAEPLLAPFVDRRLEDNGVTIEGVAVRAGRLFAGFRGPVLIEQDGDRAVILSVSLAALFGTDVPESKLHKLPLGSGRGVRDLAAFADGMLILAGPVADTGSRSYSVYWWDGVGITPKLLKDLPAFAADGIGLKPEAILPLDSTSASLRILIMFDGAREGGPRAIEVAKP